jgi:hypothetical protein
LAHPPAKSLFISSPPTGWHISPEPTGSPKSPSRNSTHQRTSDPPRAAPGCRWGQDVRGFVSLQRRQDAGARALKASLEKECGKPPLATLAMREWAERGLDRMVGSLLETLDAGERRPAFPMMLGGAGRLWCSLAFWRACNSSHSSSMPHVLIYLSCSFYLFSVSLVFVYLFPISLSHSVPPAAAPPAARRGLRLP